MQLDLFERAETVIQTEVAKINSFSKRIEREKQELDKKIKSLHERQQLILVFLEALSQTKIEQPRIPQARDPSKVIAHFRSFEG